MTEMFVITAVHQFKKGHFKKICFERKRFYFLFIDTPEVYIKN